MHLKKQIIESMKSPKSSAEDWAYDFDMEKSLTKEYRRRGDPLA